MGTEAFSKISEHIIFIFIFPARQLIYHYQHVDDGRKSSMHANIIIGHRKFRTVFRSSHWR